MNKRVVEHKIKLEKSVKIILGVLAVGVFLNAFAPVFDVRKAHGQGGVQRMALCNAQGTACAHIMSQSHGSFGSKRYNYIATHPGK